MAASQSIPTMEDVIKNLLDQQAAMAKQIADQQQLINQQISAQNQQMEQQQQAFSQILSQIKEVGIKQGNQHQNPSSLAEKGDESPNFVLSFTRAFKPTTLTEAVNYARLQEATVQAMKALDRNKSLSYQKLPQRGLLPTPTATGFKPLASPPTVMPANKPKTLTAAERAEKLAKGLCFFCDQVYEKGHQCNNKKTQGHKAVSQYLVLWEGQPASDASWEDEGVFLQQFPGFIDGHQT
ncbi:hypothetical protein Cgig2_000689 [Carnegiea gigantea]|uniref:Chromo domain-containing protein n=1 Tax=Carnegiea gigantea TaxID=171969 RepID=A0A9Q1KB49_9CARY|nr:hypothetical protein Cgig2_000689 [Carnegiea gigantea]